jgi:hypothetical protein
MFGRADARSVGVSGADGPPGDQGVDMGKTPSIQDLEARESDFRAYLQQLEQQLATKSAAAQSQLQNAIDTFYKDSGFTDAQDITTGQNYDFMQEQSFSLDNLKTIIDAIGKAVFAGAAPPAGTSVDQAGVDAATKSLGPEVGEMANLELYIAGQVFDVLSNVVLSFGTSSAVSFETNLQSKPLGYGLQLFTTVSVDSYQSKSFFNNEYIYEYLYLYAVRFSVQQAQSEVKQTLVELYEDQITVFKQREEDLLTQLEEQKITADAYQSANAAFDTLIAATQAKIDELKTAAAADVAR